LFSVDQGTRELVLPQGFGIPVLSSHEMAIATQVLNHKALVHEPK